MIKDRKSESLFNNVFKAEKERLTKINSDLSLLYNANTRSLTYKNEKGQLSISFNTEENSEEFYFRKADAPKMSGIGNKVFEITFDEKNINGFTTDDFYEMPEEFIDICDTYQYERKNFSFDINDLHKKKDDYTR